MLSVEVPPRPPLVPPTPPLLALRPPLVVLPPLLAPLLVLLLASRTPWVRLPALSYSPSPLGPAIHLRHADKGVDSALKHFGHGQSVSTTETISDGVRTAFKSVSIPGPVRECLR